MKSKAKWMLPVLAALALTLWCASAFNAQQQSKALGSVAARWPNKGVSPAQLESQLDIFREDGTKGLPEMTLWTEFSNQTLINGDGAEAVCTVTQIYGNGEDVMSGAVLQGSFPARGDTRHCALSNQAAFDLFGSANAMGQNFEWDGCTYTVQGIFESSDPLLLTQAAASSETVMPNMQLRFADGGSRQAAEEFLARTSFGNGAILLDLPLIAWGLQTLAALPALLLSGWIFARLIARLWQKRRNPKQLLLDLPLLLPLAIVPIYFFVSNLKLPAALIPSSWSDFSFWEALLTGWRDAISQWLRYPTGGDIDLIFAVFIIFALMFFAMLLGVWTLSRVKIQKPLPMFLACGGSMAMLFLLAWHYKQLQISLAMWLLPSLWLLADFALYAWGRKEGPDEKNALDAGEKN